MEGEMFQMQKFARDGKMDSFPLNLYGQTETTIKIQSYPPSEGGEQKSSVSPLRSSLNLLINTIFTPRDSPTPQPFLCGALSHRINSFYILPQSIFCL